MDSRFRGNDETIKTMIKVDQEKCIGCGTCVAICPNNFQLNANGKSEATNQDDNDCVKNAIESCPVQAITRS